MIGSNPVKEVRRDDRPKQHSRSERIPTPDELDRILAAAPSAYRPVIETAAYSGLRHAELLGLRWQDVDFDASLIRVRHQLDYQRGLAPLKTRNSKRDVVMIAQLAAMLSGTASRRPTRSPMISSSRTGTVEAGTFGTWEWRVQRRARTGGDRP